MLMLRGYEAGGEIKDLLAALAEPRFQKGWQASHVPQRHSGYYRDKECITKLLSNRPSG